MRDRFIIAIFIALAVVFGSISTDAGAFEQGPSPEISGIKAPMDEGDYIIMFSDSVSQDRRKRAVENSRGQVKFNYKIVNAVAAHLPAPALEMLRGDPDVVAIIPDRKVYAFGKLRAYARQVVPAGVQRIGARYAAYTGNGVGVAVVDTGIDFKHADLNGNLKEDCYPAFPSWQDDRGGTTRMSGTSMAAPHVAGVAALMWEKANTAITLSPEYVRSKIRSCADLKGVAPLNSPSVAYSFDREREGIVYAPCSVQ